MSSILFFLVEKKNWGRLQALKTGFTNLFININIRLSLSTSKTPIPYYFELTSAAKSKGFYCWETFIFDLQAMMISKKWKNYQKSQPLSEELGAGEENQAVLTPS